MRYEWLSFHCLKKLDEGADTDLMDDFCLPIVPLIWGYDTQLVWTHSCYVNLSSQTLPASASQASNILTSTHRVLQNPRNAAQALFTFTQIAKIYIIHCSSAVPICLNLFTPLLFQVLFAIRMIYLKCCKKKEGVLSKDSVSNLCSSRISNFLNTRPRLKCLC